MVFFNSQPQFSEMARSTHIFRDFMHMNSNSKTMLFLNHPGSCIMHCMYVQPPQVADTERASAGSVDRARSRATGRLLSSATREGQYNEDAVCTGLWLRCAGLWWLCTETTVPGWHRTSANGLRRDVAVRGDGSCWRRRSTATPIFAWCEQVSDEMQSIWMQGKCPSVPVDSGHVEWLHIRFRSRFLQALLTCKAVTYSECLGCADSEFTGLLVKYLLILNPILPPTVCLQMRVLSQSYVCCLSPAAGALLSDTSTNDVL